MLDGTLYVVTDEDPAKIPDRKYMTSTGKFIEPGKEAQRLPTDREIQTITTQQAKDLFGTTADWIEGPTVSSSTRHRTYQVLIHSTVVMH
jgi:hypothetical protein